MNARIDILLDDEFDLVEDPTTLDLVEGVADDQHVQLMLLTEKGENREFPFAGFGARSKLKSRFNKENFLRELYLQLELDGYTNATVELGNSIVDLKITI